MTVTYPRVFKFFSFELFILYWGLPTSDVVIVSDEQQRDSGIHVRVLTPRSPSPLQAACNAEQSSLCSTLGPVGHPFHM